MQKMQEIQKIMIQKGKIPEKTGCNITWIPADTMLEVWLQGALIMTDDKQNKPSVWNGSTNAETAGEPMNQAGKTFEDMFPYLLSGESDDLSSEFTAKL